MRLKLTLATLLLAADSVSLLAQQSTARDAFWSAADLVSVSTNPAAKPKADTTTKVPAQRATTHPAPKADRSTAHVDPMLVATNGYGEQPHMVRVSDQQIGLRYSLLLRDAAGKYEETSPKAIFHSGDHIRLSVMANQPGYLYVIEQGSTGSWSPIFPAAGSAQEVNRIEQGRVYQIPNGNGAFQFDQNAGQEKLFIVLSRQPIQDFDSTIQGLRRPAGDMPAQQAPAQPGSSTVYEASNRIPDELVQRFASRDLSLVQEQQVDDSPKGSNSGSAERAVYVVSKGAPAGSAPQVVASVTLRHE